jgi:hypothetical protein
MSLTEYKPGTTFPGVVGRTSDQSSLAWPEPLRAKEGAPNVLFIILDDTGFGILPIDGRGQQRFADERLQLALDRTSYTDYPGTQEVPVNAAARIINRPHSITADVDFAEGDEGVLISQGGIDGGYAIYVKDGTFW